MEFFNNIELAKLDEKNWEYYSSTLIDKNKEVWDYIIITATNKKQKLIYKEQIKIRKENKKIPLNTKFMVVMDYEEKRIGSGGSTLNVLKEIYKRKIDYKNKKILIIHSGGESKRIYQYSIQGKLFMPIQRVLPDGRASTLFDEILISFSIMPSKIDSGIVISSGDVWLMMDYSNINLKKEELIAISAKAESEKGSNHGVFLTDSNNNLERFLHKQNIEILKKYHAIKNNKVDIDTGVIYFGTELIEKFLELITTKGKYDKQKFLKLVNEKIQLSIYNDFTYVFSEKSNLAEYLQEKSEGTLCDELIKCRKEIWEKFKIYNLKILRNDLAKFIHLGTNYELINMLKNKEYNIQKSISSNINQNSEYTVNSSYIDKNTIIGKNSYIENSTIKDSKIGENTIITNAKIKNCKIPSNISLTTIKVKKNKYVSIIFGVEENPKDRCDVNTQFLNTKLGEALKKYKKNINTLTTEKNNNMWNAKLYIPEETEEESIKRTMELYRIVHCNATVQETEKYFKKNRISIKESIYGK